MSGSAAADEYAPDGLWVDFPAHVALLEEARPQALSVGVFLDLRFAEREPAEGAPLGGRELPAPHGLRLLGQVLDHDDAHAVFLAAPSADPPAASAAHAQRVAH